MTARAPVQGAVDDDRRTANEVLALFGMAILAGVYFVVRPGSLWSETDSGVMAQAIRVVMNQAQLAPVSPDAYYNGFGYQAVAMAIVTYSGVSIQTLQQEIFPVVSALVVLPSWALYRELTGSARIATSETDPPRLSHGRRRDAAAGESFCLLHHRLLPLQLDSSQLDGRIRDRHGTALRPGCDGDAGTR